MTSSVAYKTLMSLTGLFLCLFLTVHLLGNMQIFLPESEAQQQFNWYANFLSHLTIIKVAAWATYLSIALHTLLAIRLTWQNRQSVGTAYQNRSQFRLASWYSQTMGVLGVIILLFLVIHLSDFWWPFTMKSDIGLDASGHRDLYGLVKYKFRQGWKVVLYVVAVIALGFHLLHGVYSGLRSLGVYHPGYAKIAQWLGYGFAIAITIGFGLMPIFIYLRQ